MKKKLIFTFIVLSSINFIFSCNDGKIVNDVIPQTSKGANNARQDYDALSHEDMGIFIYNTVKRHSSHFDPYTLLAEKERASLTSKIDSIKALKISDPNVVWEQAVKDGKMTKNVFDNLKKFKADGILFLNGESNIDAVDRWFVSEIEKTKNDESLLFDEKDVILQNKTTIRYIFKAYLEASIPNKSVKNGRKATSCVLQMISCIWGNVSTYMGIGSYVAGQVGGSVGALIGLFISYDSCSCDSEDCSYPKFISTPDICYVTYNGLDLITAGFGSSTNHLTWYFTDSNGIPFLIRDSNANVTHLYNEDLGGRTYFEVYVTAFCDGGAYPTSRVGIDINNLGKPSFFISGNTNPQVGSQQVYNISGRNLNNLTWGLGSIGQIVYQNSYGITVNWNSTGYTYLYASAQSDCGYASNGINVVVHN